MRPLLASNAGKPSLAHLGRYNRDFTSRIVCAIPSSKGTIGAQPNSLRARSIFRTEIGMSKGLRALVIYLERIVDISRHDLDDIVERVSFTRPDVKDA